MRAWIARILTQWVEWLQATSSTERITTIAYRRRDGTEAIGSIKEACGLNLLVRLKGNEMELVVVSQAISHGAFVRAWKAWTPQQFFYLEDGTKYYPY